MLTHDFPLQDLKPLNHLTVTALLAGMCPFQNVFCFCFYRKSKMAATTKHSFNIGPYGKKKQIFSETIDLIVPKLYTIKHLMVPYKIVIFLCRSEIQDSCQHSVNLTQNPMGKMILNYLYQKSQNHLTTNFPRMWLR